MCCNVWVVMNCVIEGVFVNVSWMFLFFCSDCSVVCRFFMFLYILWIWLKICFVLMEGMKSFLCCLKSCRLSVFLVCLMRWEMLGVEMLRNLVVLLIVLCSMIVWMIFTWCRVSLCIFGFFVCILI